MPPDPLATENAPIRDAKASSRCRHLSAVATPTASSTPNTQAEATSVPPNAKAKLKPLQAPFIVMYASAHACMMVHLLCVASFAPGHSRSSIYQMLALSAFELLTVVVCMELLHGIRALRFTPAQVKDRFLLINVVIIPSFQILMARFHPPFLRVEKNWSALQAFVLGEGVFVARFRPAHSLVQWLVSTLSFTFVDCYDRGNYQQECSPSSWGLPACMLSRGCVIGAAGLVSWVTAYIVVTKRKLRTQADSIAKQSDPRADGLKARSGHSPPDQQPANAADSGQEDTAGGVPSSRIPLPFETLGIRVPASISYLLCELDHQLNRLTAVVNEEVIVRVVCLPFAICSVLFTLLARFHFQGFSFNNISPDTVALSMCAWFMVGRDSCHFDIAPLLQQIKTSLAASFARAARPPSLEELVDRVRLHVSETGSVAASDYSGSVQPVKLTKLLGQGVFGKVYKGTWRGIPVAVKCMTMPGSLNKSERRERMAIMEAAISTALVHPNVIRTHTYIVTSLRRGISRRQSKVLRDVLTGSTAGCTPDLTPSGSGILTDETAEGEFACSASGLEVQLVLEYMDCGSLRHVLDQGHFFSTSPAGPVLNYPAVLETAADVAKGMLHLHSLNIIHSDLKACNVLLRSSETDPRGFSAKISDFGLSLKMETTETHVSSMFQGTNTHMAPEVHLTGCQSKAADVYSFGITMWELYTGGEAFRGVNKAMLGYLVLKQGERPAFPPDTPQGYQSLASRCWSPDPEERPSFGEIVEVLAALRQAQGGETVAVPVTVFEAQEDPAAAAGKVQDASIHSAAHSAHMVDTGTPVEKIMDVLTQFIMGEAPEMQEVIALRSAILQSGGLLFQPQDLRGQLQFNRDLPDDVVESLVHQLQGRSGAPVRDLQAPPVARHGRGSILRRNSRTMASHGLSRALSLIMQNDASLPSSPHGHCLDPPSHTLQSGQGNAPALAGVNEGSGDSSSWSGEAAPPCLRVSLDATLQHLLTYEAEARGTSSPQLQIPLLSPEHPPGDQVVQLLEASYSSWTFDSFQLAEATNNHPLSSMLFFLLARSGLMRDMRLNPSTVARLALAIEDGYFPNPYHNKLHATNVLQAMHAMLVNTGMVVEAGQKGYAPPETLLACLLAAAGHDIGHIGLTNDFLIQSEDQLATLYSDKSPMESHHLARLWTLLRDPRLNILSSLTKEERFRVRKTVIELVCATDMKNHFAMLSQFSLAHQLSGNRSSEGKSTAGQSSDTRATAAQARGQSMLHGAQRCIPVDETEQMLSLQVALKCADMGHMAQDTQFHCQWVSRLEAEFFAQGDRERSLGIPISPLSDRNKPGISKSQVGFCDFVALPLFHNFSCAFPGAKPVIDMARTNCKYWKSLIPAVDANTG